MIFNKVIYLFIFFLCWVFSAISFANEQVITLYESVDQALNYSPQLKALTHSHEAIEYDLKQSHARYLPSIDLLLGQGVAQHSDDVTRQAGADPANTDWDSRGDATLRLTQKVYDGKETSHQISINKALLDSARFHIQDAAQAIVLNAISVHLDVYRQRELVELAKKNLRVHKDIYQSLAEREKVGAGSIADVTQAQARMARAQSNLFSCDADLSIAIANYARVVGTKPGDLAYAEAPESIMPGALEEALRWTEQRNPELMAFKSNIIEADARVALTRSRYKPKINIELSSRYNDQLEGDRSWQNTNEAMLMLRWNIFNGGQDKAGENAALSRKYQSRSNRDDKLLELREATSAAWATYVSLRSQKKAYQDAATYSLKTFDAYLKQFSVSQRSLLDVLSAENDYFQYASQLVTVSVNETIAAYRILRLGGELQFSMHLGVREYPEDLSRLAQAIVVPSAIQTAHTESQAHPPQIATESPVRVSAVTEDNLVLKTESETTDPAKLYPLYSIKVGPCINKLELEKADKIVHSHGFNARQTSGTGTVRFIRLLEGVYTTDEALKRLKALKKIVNSAFLLPEGGQLALYAGSFHESDRAICFKELLGQKQIEVSMVAAKIEMQGIMLVVQLVDRQTAEMIVEEMSTIGLTAKLNSG